MNKAAQTEESNKETQEEIWSMFDQIAPRYDLANRLLSFGQDVLWRKEISRVIPHEPSSEILDIATGTADVPLSLVKNKKNIRKVYGIDMSSEMLKVGTRKIAEYSLENKISLSLGDATDIPFPDNRFDVVTIAFGIRNIKDTKKALQEMKRVCKPGGSVIILEFSLPENPLMRKFYLFYFQKVLPVVAGWITGKKDAYRYLNSTVMAFPYGREFSSLLQQTGFIDIKTSTLSWGIASLYQAHIGHSV